MLQIKELPHICGIYKITNKINTHCYIGQSTDIYNRFNCHHIYDYINPKSPNYNFQIYQAFRKYGLENFKVTILEECQPNELDEREIYWIKYFNSFEYGYNATPGGQNWSPLIHTELIEAKRAATRKKNKSLNSENHPRAKLSNIEVEQIRNSYEKGENVDNIWQRYKHLYPSKDVFRRIIFGQSYSDIKQIDKETIRYTNAKLTKEQVLDIRTKFYTLNYSQSDLAREYNVSPNTIKGICDRTSYSHINDNIPDLRKKQNYRLSPAEVKEIRKEWAEGKTFSALAKKYGVGVSAISRCCRRITYTEVD